VPAWSDKGVVVGRVVDMHVRVRALLSRWLRMPQQTTKTILGPCGTTVYSQSAEEHEVDCWAPLYL
jgi:hypothetical protein